MRSAHAAIRWLGICAFGLVLACWDTPPRRPVTSASEPDGQTLYARYCSLCHGTSGEGYRADHANALSNQDFLASASDGFLRAAIAQGRPGTTMSAWGKAFGGPLTSTEIDVLVRRLRAWQREPSFRLGRGEVHGDPGRAAPLFAARCASCHGAQGQGKHAISLNNPVVLAGFDGHVAKPPGPGELAELLARLPELERR
jgi:cytochrome c oxidase cbb3-type subunit 3